MKRYLLDTDVCAFFLRKCHRIAEKIAAVGVWNCSISWVTAAELRYGAECSDFSRQCHQEVDEFCEYLSVVPVDDAVIHVFAFQKACLRKRGELIPDFDLLIGSTAIHHGLTVVTNNVRHFGRMQTLRIENWVE